MARRGRGRVWDANRRRLRIYRPIQLFHAGPGGDLVLKGEASWRTVSGLLVNTRFGHVWFMFRRWSQF